MTNMPNTAGPTAHSLIDQLLRVQDIIDELVAMKRHCKLAHLRRLKDAIDALQEGKETLDTFRDGLK